MLCLKETPKTVNHKKQYVRKLTLQSAEDRIRLAVELKKDERLFSVIRGTKSLLCAEFRCHEKCQSDYVRIVPATKKRKTTTEPVENVQVSVVGAKRLRKRQALKASAVDEETDDAATGMNFPESSSDIGGPESVGGVAPESVGELVSESVGELVPESVSELVTELFVL